MNNHIHLAAQYLATAAICLLEKKEDDSHTNLGFDAKTGYLNTWPLNNEGSSIAFDYNQFSLHWMAYNKTKLTLPLDGKTHKEIVIWMRRVTTAQDSSEPYKYALHYDLPYEEITDDFMFSKPAQSELSRSLKYRGIAQKALETVVAKFNLNTNIRIWPHHFDTGGYAIINPDKQIAVGFGLAIPDTMVDNYYLYTAGYRGNESVDTSKFDAISYGKWRNQGFKGAVLSMEDVDETSATLFFTETIGIYKALGHL